MGRTTANSILLIKKFVEQIYSRAAARKTIDELTPEERRRFLRLEPEEWVEYDLYFHLLEAAARAVGREPILLAMEFGRFQAEHDTMLLHRAALRLGGPGVMILESDQIWRRYHDTGHFKIYEVLPRSARARVEGMEGGGPLLCAVVQGFIAAGLELTGAREVKVEHIACRFRGDQVCEYMGTWER